MLSSQLGISSSFYPTANLAYLDQIQTEMR